MKKNRMRKVLTAQKHESSRKDTIQTHKNQTFLHPEVYVQQTVNLITVTSSLTIKQQL